MRKITKNKSISNKTTSLKVLRKKRAILTIPNYFFVILGIVLGIPIAFFVVGRNVESINKKNAESAIITANQDSAQKNPIVNSTNLPLPLVSVLGSAELVSNSEIRIKNSTCQGEEEFTGKISAKTEIIKKEKRGNSPTIESVKANISDVRKGDPVTLEAYEAVRVGQTFDVKRVIIQEPFSLPGIIRQ